MPENWTVFEPLTVLGIFSSCQVIYLTIFYENKTDMERDFVGRMAETDLLIRALGAF